VLIAGLVAAALAGAGADPAPLSVRITSPLGRSGISGAVRIVARVEHPQEIPVQQVKFFVNKTLVGEDREGPVYAVEWVDDNPFLAAAVEVEVTDTSGRSARDLVSLTPFEFVETAEVLSVLLEATVQDRHGRFINGMAPAGFLLHEDGVRQQLEVVRPETLRATYVMLVDSSQSMSRREDFLRAAAARLMRYLHPDDRVMVIPFSRTLGSITGPTADPVTVGDALATIQPKGGTAIFDALVSVAGLVGKRDGRHVIVLVSDGYDEHSTSSIDDAVRAVQASGATTYVIGVGGVAGISLKGEQLLRRIAADTGGRAFFPFRESELPQVHDRVASDVAHRYLITYTPTNQRIDGTWRSVELKTADPALVVRTRPGYYAPKPPPVRATLEFTATDDRREYLDVVREDLVVVEDGVAQEVDAFFEATSPVSIVMVIDESGSMRRAAEGVKAAARSFVDAIRDEDKLATIRFSDTVVLAHDLTLFRSDARQAIDEYTPRGGTALYDALVEALGRLRRLEGRRVVVLMTDGRDENNAGTGPGSLASFDEVMNRARESGAVVYTIGLGTNLDRDKLQQIADLTGGEAYFPATVEALAADYARVVENLRRRYVISYNSTNTTRNGAWRTVSIESKRPGIRVTSAGGYFAPGK
jgi:VWFA-related protein